MGRRWSIGAVAPVAAVGGASAHVASEQYRGMSAFATPLQRALSWPELWPSIRAGMAVVALFAVALLLAREFAPAIRNLLSTHAGLGIAVFVATSVVAVLVPTLTNLPLVPLAVLAWGPWWTAVLLLLGWVLGATLSFQFGRFARASI
jgi:uncharacterized membrane protein YdjX (TVP38/TMEM64 family)